MASRKPDNIKIKGTFDEAMRVLVPRVNKKGKGNSTPKKKGK